MNIDEIRGIVTGSPDPGSPGMTDQEIVDAFNELFDGALSFGPDDSILDPDSQRRGLWESPDDLFEWLKEGGLAWVNTDGSIGVQQFVHIIWHFDGEDLEYEVYIDDGSG